MRLLEAIPAESSLHLGIVGAGGKTTLLFRLAREFPTPVIVSASTHLAKAQLGLGDDTYTITNEEDIDQAFSRLNHPVSIFTGPIQEDGRAKGLSFELLTYLRNMTARRLYPILIEADGSRMHPIKAPAEHEPALPGWVNSVAVVAGLSGLNHPLNSDWVHRPEVFARLSGLNLNDIIRESALANVLIHPEGGLKSIPNGARRIAILNQCDSADLLSSAINISRILLAEYDMVLACRLNDTADPVKCILTR